MSTRRQDTSKQTRLQLVCTEAQKHLIEDRAKKARTDSSTWVLAHLLKPAGIDSTEGSPIIVGGKVADRLRTLAAQQGTHPDRVLEQLLIAEG